jgi:hypothetical protein
VLEKHGLTKERVRSEVIKAVGVGNQDRVAGQIPFSAGAKEVLWLARGEADELGSGHASNHRAVPGHPSAKASGSQDTWIAPHHLLLALLRVGDGNAGHVIRALGVDPAKLRQEVLGHVLGEAP